MTLDQYNRLCASIEEITGLKVFYHENNITAGYNHILLQYNRMQWVKPKKTVNYKFEISLVGDIYNIQSMLGYSEDEINFDKLINIPNLSQSNIDPVIVYNNDWFFVEYNIEDSEKNENNEQLIISKSYILNYQVNL